MNKVFQLLLFVLGTTSVFAQKHDHNWILGYHGQNPHPLQNNMVIDFNEVLKEVIPLELDSGISLGETNTCVSDKEGELLFYTNGISIFNANHNLMENGDSLGLTEFSLNFYDTGLTLIQGALILPHPTNDSLYYLFHMAVDWNVDIGSHVPLLFYSLINVNGNTGDGLVVDKNNLILEDTLLAGKLTATRHANGRDWWVITGEDDSYTNVLYKFLVTPDGIINKGKEDVGPGLIYDVLSVGNAVFTPDGTKYIRHDIRFDPWNVVDIYDFDRCNGEFLHIEHIELADTSFLYGGSSVSPDSRYLYSVTNNVIYQFDLLSNDIGSTKTIVAEYDGFVGLLFGTVFGTPQSAPDGTILIATVSDTVLHVIQTPNQFGLASNVQQHSLHLPKINQKSIPNFPNYRLGPIDGSPCDTLGLDNRPLAGFTYFSEELSVTFSDNSYYRPEEWDWDFGDNNGSIERNPIHDYDEPGEYYVCLTVSNDIDEDTYCRWVEVDTVMAVGTFSSIADMVKVELTPNPAHGNLSLFANLDGFENTTFALYDVTGKFVQYWELNEVQKKHSFLLENISDGMYFWKLSVGGRFLKGGRIVIVK